MPVTDRKSETWVQGARDTEEEEKAKEGIATAQNRHCHHLRLSQNVSRVKGLETLLKLPVKKAQASEHLLDKPPGF